ncbi:alpha/beta hydrolase [Kitasatospora viridis]|uniref:Alpha/beta hydrolase family protein n=1 Tax=Kitasatospora viridis TaxID=281105 RepID=A0A561UJQ3_9ACTN|nr:alpha/beta hydrolase [Kitasatospora viridis]TWF99587.1 alpha/beta hydrolase family protein [Kitasatospora viridis]
MSSGPLRRRQLRRLAPAVLAGALLLAGCTSGPTPSAAAGAGAAGAIRWTDCGGGLQCGELRVPLDWSRPGGDTLELALIRQPAADPAHRVGSLVVNPGGPGESGVAMVRDDGALFTGPLHDHYDIVGFDPRGTGASSPIHCLTDRQRDAQDQQDDPADPNARAARQAQKAEQYAAACEKAAGKLLPFVGTRSTARDMDALRQALGQPKLDYLGVSYGTYLGALYAEQFPQNTGRLVLDGAVDPAADRLQTSVSQQIGFEKSLEAFAADCATRHADQCPLGTDPAAAGERAAEFLDGLRDHPLATGDPDHRKLTSTLGWTGTLLFLYGDQNTAWPQLRSALAAAMQRGDGSELLAAADGYNGRLNGHYTASDDAQTAISCADSPAVAPDPQQVQQALTALKTQAPLLNRDTTAQDLALPGCADWPYRTTERPHTVRAEGSAPILVVGSTDDPATPYQQAVNLAAGLADGVLLTRQGQGHAAFGSGNACTTAAIDAYLVSGTLPAEGTSCPA